MPIGLSVNAASLPAFCTAESLYQQQRPGDRQDVFLQELQHRVRNDLQAITGVLELEHRRTTDQRSATQLKALLGRILCIASMYELLSHGGGTTVDLGDYLRLLCSRMSTAKDLQARAITLEAEVISILTTPDLAVLVGIIVNELTTNAVKHAFKHSDGGAILVGLQLDEGPRLTVHDNGEAAAEQKLPGHGLELVHRLATAIGGTLTCDRTSGTCWRLAWNFARPTEVAPVQSGATP